MKKYLTILIGVLAIYASFASFKIYSLQREHGELFTKNSKLDSEVNALIKKLTNSMSETNECEHKVALDSRLTESEKIYFLKKEDALDKEIQTLKIEITNQKKLQDSLQKSTYAFINASKVFTTWTSNSFKRNLKLISSKTLMKKKSSTRDLIELAQEKYKNFDLQDDIYNARCNDTAVDIYSNSSIGDQSELAITNCYLEKDSYEYPLVYKINKEKIYPIVNLHDYSFMYESGGIFNVSDLNNDGNFELWLQGDVCECDDPDEKNCDCNGISVVEESEGIAFFRH